MTEREQIKAHQDLLKKARKDGSWAAVYASAEKLPGARLSGREAEELGAIVSAVAVRGGPRRI